MVLLYCGAMVFALIEDPQLYSIVSTTESIDTSDHANLSHTSNETHTFEEVIEFWIDLETDFEVHVDVHDNDTKKKLLYEVHQVSN